MTIQIKTSSNRLDLSLLAIKAAEELERFRKSLDTNFKSVETLSTILQNSFSRQINKSDSNYRLDHVSVVSSAISNSFGSALENKTISEIAEEARKIASLLNTDSINSKGHEIQNLINFCVALSDSAALYKEELDELKKQFA